MTETKLDPAFFESEIRQGYQITAEAKRLWAVELELLRELDRVCKKLGLKYFLDSGTLLGAVRDGHFIPWDDDIDVIMLRKDYNKLVEDAGKSFGDDYFFQCAYTDTLYFRGHAQLRKKGTCAMLPYEAKHVKFDQGVFIDVFVLDGIAPSKEELKEQFRQKEKIRKLLQIISNPASPNKIKMAVKVLLAGPCKLVYRNVVNFYSKYEEICSRYEGSEYVDKIMFRTDCSKVIYQKKEWFADSINIDFEGEPFPVPVGYDDVLKSYFGDNYMIPKKAPTMHGGLIIDVDRSYKEVLKNMRQKKSLISQSR